MHVAVSDDGVAEANARMNYVRKFRIPYTEWDEINDTNNSSDDQTLTAYRRTPTVTTSSENEISQY